MIKVGIVGGTGYTGVELLRLLAAHPQVALQVITSRADAGTPVNRMFPSLRGYVDIDFTHPDQARLEDCDLVFFATPNGIAMQQTRALLDAGCGSSIWQLIFGSRMWLNGASGTAWNMPVRI